MRAALTGRARFALVATSLLAAAASFSSCSVGDVMSPRVDVGAQTAAVPPRGLARLVPSNPMMASYPRLSNPFAAPGTAMPAEEAACRKRLRRLGVTYRDLAPINEGGACRVDHPVQVTRLSGGIEMKPAATLTCAMAEAFAGWTKNELASAARWKSLSGVKTIHQGSSYSCRNVRGTGTASEHSRGNALDVARIELKNGRDIDVRKPGWFAFRERSLLKNVRKGGCDYFTTVLGPGYDADHADHFHFDIRERRNGYVACR